MLSLINDSITFFVPCALKMQVLGEEGDDSSAKSEDENVMNNLNAREIEDDVDYEDIMGLSLPPHVYPLVVAPLSRTKDSEVQPVLAIPNPRSSLLDRIDALATETSETLKFSSKDALDNFDMTRVASMLREKREGEGEEFEKLIKSEEAEDSMDLSAVASASFDLEAAGRVLDGMHVGHAASMAPVQLRAEDLFLSGGISGGKALREMQVPQDVHLSRVTQRIMRDLTTLKVR